LDYFSTNGTNKKNHGEARSEDTEEHGEKKEEDLAGARGKAAALRVF
jgi:hypothetical protein